MKPPIEPPDCLHVLEGMLPENCVYGFAIWQLLSTFAKSATDSIGLTNEDWLPSFDPQVCQSILAEFSFDYDYDYKVDVAIDSGREFWDQSVLISVCYPEDGVEKSFLVSLHKLMTLLPYLAKGAKLVTVPSPSGSEICLIP